MNGVHTEEGSVYYQSHIFEPSELKLHGEPIDACIALCGTNGIVELSQLIAAVATENIMMVWS